MNNIPKSQSVLEQFLRIDPKILSCFILIRQPEGQIPDADLDLYKMIVLDCTEIAPIIVNNPYI